MSSTYSFTRFFRWPEMAILGLSLVAIAFEDITKGAMAEPVPRVYASPTSRATTPETQTSGDVPQESLYHIVEPVESVTDAPIKSIKAPNDIVGAEFPRPHLSRQMMESSMPGTPQEEAIANSSPVAAGSDARGSLLAQQSDCEGGLKVDSVRNTVTVAGRQIKPGDCLQAGSGEIVSSEDSTARLVRGGNRGSLEISEFSSIKVETLTDSDAEMFVNSGQVRFSVANLSSDSATSSTYINSAWVKTLLAPPFFPLTGGTGEDRLSRGENSEIAQRSKYRFRVRTPTTVAGVRGTSFGVDVGPNGKTGISTIYGSVAVEAQGQEVIVESGQYTVVNPGSPPTKPERSPQESTFRVLVRQRRGGDTIRVQGQVGRADILYINGQAIKTDLNGNFSELVNRPASGNVRFVVRGPATTQRAYVIPLR